MDDEYATWTEHDNTESLSNEIEKQHETRNDEMISSGDGTSNDIIDILNRILSHSANILLKAIHQNLNC